MMLKIYRMFQSAPRYAKMLPELPRLVHDYLARPPSDHHRELMLVVKELKRSNHSLRRLLHVGGGFALGLLAMHLAVRGGLW